MSLSFPRSMTIGTPWAVADFKLVHRQEMAVRASGRPQGKDLGPPLFHANFKSMPLSKMAGEKLEAEFDAVGGLRNWFWVHAAKRSFPAFYTSPPAFGAATVDNIHNPTATIRIQTTASSPKLRAGDFLEIENQAGVKYLHRVVEDKNGNGSGLLTGVSLEPFVRPSVQVGDSVNFIQPQMLAVLEPESNQLVRVSGNLYYFAFQAIQVLI